MTCSNLGKMILDPSLATTLVLIIAPSSEVGSCMYCAFQFFVEIDALTQNLNLLSFQYSGHTGLSFGKIAGNEITFH